MRQVSIKETNANEPLKMCRNKGTLKVKTGGIKDFQDKSKGEPVYCLDGLRHIDGVTLIQAFMWNYGNLSLQCKGRTSSGKELARSRVPRRSTEAD
jgi:hypothetical protein